MRPPAAALTRTAPPAPHTPDAIRDAHRGLASLAVRTEWRDGLIVAHCDGILAPRSRFDGRLHAWPCGTHRACGVRRLAVPIGFDRESIIGVRAHFVKGTHMETNLLRVTDKYDDPVEELRIAANAVAHATRRLLERAVDNGPLGDVARAIMTPRIRRVEDPSTIVVTMEIPGTERESLEVTLSSKNVLCIKGKGTKKASPRKTRNVDASPESRTFERTVPLSGRDLVQDKATAYLESGVLTVTIPKKESPTDSGASDSEKRVRAA